MRRRNAHCRVTWQSSLEDRMRTETGPRGLQIIFTRCSRHRFAPWQGKAGAKRLSKRFTRFSTRSVRQWSLPPSFLKCRRCPDRRKNRQARRGRRLSAGNIERRLKVVSSIICNLVMAPVRFSAIADAESPRTLASLRLLSDQIPPPSGPHRLRRSFRICLASFSH